MAFQIRYRPLCVVTIRHGFHLNKGSKEFDDLEDDDEKQRKEKQQKLSDFNIFDDLRLEVPDDTQHTLAALGLLLKPTPTGFIIGSQAEAEESSPGVFVPRITPRNAYRLRFVLRARAPFFWDYTNLDLRHRDREIYYLSNRAGELGGSFPSLSAPPPMYASGTVYRAGDVIRTSSESVRRFLAVRKGTHETPHETPIDDDPNWLPIGPPDNSPNNPRNYVGTADRAALYPPTFSWPFPSATVTTAAAELVEPNGSVRKVGSAAAPSGKTLDKLMIDARSAAPGHYLLKVNEIDKSGNQSNHSENVYIDADLQASRVFSIVELFHEPAKPEEPGDPLGDFRLYDNDENAALRLREPEFRVYLLNRHTFWRYHFTKLPKPETDLGDLERVDGQYVTKRPMPLTRGVATVAFAGNDLLPNPPGGPVVPESDRMYSDIYVHTR